MREKSNVTGSLVHRIIPAGVAVAALEFAGLERSALLRGSHPDNGYTCVYLAADIQQYSAFVAALAVQHRSAGDLAPLVDGVQLQHDEKGDTRFWFPGIEVGI